MSAEPPKDTPSSIRDATARSGDAEIYIGPAGWSYDDWKGIVYPRGGGRRFDPLAYLADYFDVVEINSSFYRPPPRQWARAWAARVEHRPRFRFTAKLWRRFTHERSDPPDRDDVAAVRDGFDALAEEDRLLAVLVQFPWSFRNESESRQWLESLVDTFSVYPLVIEVRHASWDVPGIHEWMAERGIGLAAIDQPIHEGSLGPVVRRIGPVTYFRFHGRNYAEWFAEGRPSHERYNYLYEPEELESWVEEIRAAEEDEAVAAVIAITNNHYQGKGAVNALQLKSWSTGERVEVPQPLLEAYPEALAEVATDASEAPEQGELFDTAAERSQRPGSGKEEPAG